MKTLCLTDFLKVITGTSRRGAPGAALASLITQIFTSIILPYCIKDLRPNAKLMIEAIILKDVFFKPGEKNGTDI